MAEVLAAHRVFHGNPSLPSAEQFDASYTHLVDCDPDTDIIVIEHVDGRSVEMVGYGRTSWTDLETGVRDCVVFCPTHPDHLTQPLLRSLVGAQEQHMAPWAEQAEHARYRAYATHPGPGLAATGEAAWLELLDYRATEWEAWLVRPDLDGIPERRLPEGVEVRTVQPDQVRPIWEAHWEAFRGEWDFKEPTAADIDAELAEPFHDPSLWKVAWSGDQIVGQVKSYINHEENAERGYLRGYTEYISTHREWRNRGIASALLALSLYELKARGMTDAALGVDTNNPGGAFQVYTSLGFELQNYEAIYTKPIH
jgi:ribosomal protein S18 acetylase RimI-like enzyme